MSDYEKEKNEIEQSDGTKEGSKPAVTAKSSKSKKKPNIFSRMGKRIVRWFVEMKSELKKVVWPTPKQLLNNTLIVLAVVVLVGAVIALFDFGLSTGVQAIINLVRGY